MGVDHDRSPLAAEHGPPDPPSVPASSPYVLGIDLNRSELSWPLLGQRSQAQNEAKDFRFVLDSDRCADIRIDSFVP
jgi:hypothetical protein